ncbi:hypothetical protein ACFSTJ_07645 [Ottowia pentelensis]
MSSSTSSPAPGGVPCRAWCSAATCWAGRSTRPPASPCSIGWSTPA